MAATVLFDPFHGPIGEGVGGIEIGAGLDLLAIVVKGFEGEIISPSPRAVRMIEAAIHGIIWVGPFGGRADMPLPDVIRAVTGLAQEFGNRGAMLVEALRVARWVPLLEHVPDAGLMRI